MGLHGFLLSSQFIDGGVTGVSMLISKVFSVPLSVLILVFNLPFIALGYRQIGRDFAIRSTLAIFGLAVVLSTIHYPDVTAEQLLTAVFGGFFIGAGRAWRCAEGPVSTGTTWPPCRSASESYVFRRANTSFSGFSIVIFLIAAKSGGRLGLDSILIYISASKTLEFILHGIEEYTAIVIVSERSMEIRKGITGGRAGRDHLQGERRDYPVRIRQEILLRGDSP